MGVPGVSEAAGAPGRTTSPGLRVKPGGSGCFGPDRICPGRAAGGGAGLAGVATAAGGAAAGCGLLTGCVGATGGRSGMDGLVLKGGTTGRKVPPASGGRIGCGATRGSGTGGSSSILWISTVVSSAWGSGGAAIIRVTCGIERAGLSGSAGVAGGGSTAGPAADCSSGTVSKAVSTATASSSPSSAPAPPPASTRLISFARSSSSELEWVFLSAIPKSGRRSRMRLGLTSNSRANSLMRILLINPAGRAPIARRFDTTPSV
jgi:hypothetical protein